MPASEARSEPTRGFASGKASEGMRWLVGEAEAEERLDRALAQLAGVPRAQVQRWLEAGVVTCNAAPARASQRVEAGDLLAAEPPEPVALALEPEPIPLAILHEDEALLVLDKPAGLVVHPAPGHPRGTLVHALLHHCRDLAGVGGVLRPGIVHRLDAGTSGVMVVAKTDAAHQALSLQFHEKKDEAFFVQEGTLELVLGRGAEQQVVRLGPGTSRRIVPRTVHRFRAVTDVLLFEVSTPELEDVVRLEDDYGREGTTDALPNR